MLSLLACAPTPHERADRAAEVAAWWVEDVAHGNSRTVQELDHPDDADDGIRRFAAWARSGESSGHLPRLLVERRSRWPALASLLGAGTVILDHTRGLAVMPRAGSEDRALARDAVSSELKARSTMDVTVLSLLRADASIARRYRAAVAGARAKLDLGPTNPLH